MNSPLGTVPPVGSGSPILEKRQARDAKEKVLEAQVALMGGGGGIKNPIVKGEDLSEKDAMQRLAQKIALMEFQAKEAVQRYQNSDEAKVQGSDVFAELPALKDHVQDLKLLRTLKNRLLQGENEIMDLKAKCGTVNDVQFQLTGSRRVIKVLEDKLDKANLEKTEVIGKKADVDFCLTEARRLAKFMETRAVSVLEDKKALELKLTAESKKLQFQLTEAVRISKWLESSLIEARKQKADADLEATATTKNLQFKLTESGRVCQFVQSKFAESEEANRALEAKIKTLEFKLCESNRISTFVQSKLLKTIEEKTEVEAKVKELEMELRALQLRLELKNSLIEASREEAEKATQESLKFQGKLSVAQKMSEFLQGALCRSEEEKLSTSDSKHIELFAEVKALKGELEESHKTTKSLQSDLTMARDETRVTQLRVQDLEMDLQALDDKLLSQKEAHASRKERFMEQAAKIDKLTEQLATAQESVVSAEQLNSAEARSSAARDGYNALRDLEFRLTQAEVAKQTMQSDMAALKADKEAAEAKISDLERKLEQN